LPIFEITLESGSECCFSFGKFQQPTYSGIENIAPYQNGFQNLGKPTSRPYRRMAVALVNDTLETQLKKW
jgi:phosphoribosylglycinamide formyltransferase 2